MKYELQQAERGARQVWGFDRHGHAVEQWRLKGSDYQYRSGFGEPWKNARETPPPIEVISLLNPTPPEAE